MTLEELADELDYHHRTVRRDVEVLESSGFPIERERDAATRKVKLKVAAGCRTPAIPFNLMEVLSIYFAGNLLKSLRGTPMKEGIDTAIRKIEKTLPVHVLEYVDQSQNALVAKPGPLKDYRAHVETLGKIQQAVAEKRKLEVTYRAYGRPKADRHVYRPYCLCFVDGSLYVIGHSELRGAMRTLLLERVEGVRLQDGKFEMPQDFDADDYLAESFGIWHEDATHEVKIEFSREVAQLIREREWHPSQRLEERKNGRVHLTMRVTGLPQLVSWVLSFGHHAKALNPEDLVQQVHGQLLLAAGHYRTRKSEMAPRKSMGTSLR